MHHAVDLDQVHRPVGRADDAVQLAAHDDAAVHVVEAGDDGVGGLAVDDDAVPAGRRRERDDGVDDAAQLQLQCGAGLVLRLRTPAVGGGEQPLGLDRGVLLVRLDGRDDQRDAGVLVGDEAALGAHAVDPARVGPLHRRRAARGLEARPDHLGLLQQLQHEALVRGAAVDHDGGLAHGAAQAAEGLVAGAAVGDDLGDHRVEVGGDGVALGDAGVDADARARREVEAGDAAGGRGEVAIRVLGVQPGLDGVAELDRAFIEPAPRGDVDLRLDEVELVGDLGDRVLDLEARVDLEEREHPVAGVVEELDGAGALVADREREALGGGLDVGHLLGGQQRGGRLLDDLLVAALHRAVADAERPGGLAVGDELHLDVAGAGDEALQEDDAAAERALGLVAGALVGVGQVVGGVDAADAAPTAAGRRLEHQGVADPVCRREGLLQGVDAAARPRRDGHADLLGDQLGADLVAQLAHGVAGGADEGDAEGFDEVGEGRVLGDEAPPDPHGVGLGLLQHAGQELVVQVGALGGGADRVGLVGLPGEHGRALAVGEQRDRRGLWPARVLRVQVPHRVDEPHGGLAPVDDGDPLEHQAS